MTGHRTFDEVCLKMIFSDTEAVANTGEEETTNYRYLDFPEGPYRNDGYDLNQKLEDLLIETLMTELSHESHSLPCSSFANLKIWLYNTKQPKCSLSSQAPDIDEHSLEICSHLVDSQLERIYVLDSGLSGHDYTLWKASCQALFAPLFDRFLVPRESPEVLDNFLVMRYGNMFFHKIYLSLGLKTDLFFNALVIQTY